MNNNRRSGWGSLIAALIIGVLIGWFAIGWGLWPVRWTNTDPVDLRQEQREDYLLLVAGDFTMNHNAEQALRRLDSWPSLADADREIRELADFLDVHGRSSQAQLLRMLSQGLPLPTGSQSMEQPAGEARPATSPNLWTIVKGVLVAAAVVGLAAILLYLYGQRRQRTPRDRPREQSGDRPLVSRPPVVIDQTERGGPVDEYDEYDEYEQMEDTTSVPRRREGIMPKVFRRTPPPAAMPAWRFEAAYEGEGMDFDQTFTLDDPDGEYYGECGVGAATFVGVDLERVNALEVWLFDKSDIRTVAKVLMSEQAYNDQSLREELASRGEPVLAVPGAMFSLAGNSIQADVVVEQVSYLSGEPSNSSFGHVALQFQAGRLGS